MTAPTANTRDPTPLLSKLVGRPGTGSYPAPSPDVTTPDLLTLVRANIRNDQKSKLPIVIFLGGVLMIALFCVLQVAMSQEFETNADGGLHHIPGFSTEHRQKRSLQMLTFLGVRAWKMLTLGATKVDSKLANVRQYEKKGDYRLAVDQFIALEPKENLKFLSDMKGKMTGMSAQVGDRTVALKFPSNSRFPGSVTIQMYKTSDNVIGRRVDVIKYVE